ncbi:hypothetical protein [Hydrogenimonas thermophila]|uniref:JHP0747 family n=1 Tax=Hydrogenimonas thermophila TaxID=223786 RepID=A0A1I5MUZ6_9BACT|nr:hypothetical protein [Hydrogenimonas thermophila]SFP12896.1 hypothetical protein SAMN05216234_10716 [Hydrogenimonas thermophila]
MKIALNCKSLLLEKALKNFLSQYIVSENEANILITDNSVKSNLPIFHIGYNDPTADLQKPFSRSQLMIKLEDKLKTIKQKDELNSIITEEDTTIEKEIEQLTKQFTNDLLKIFKKYAQKDN